MKISIAQTIPGFLSEQIEQSYKVALEDESEVIIFSSRVLHTPELSSPIFGGIEQALSEIAVYVCRKSSNPLHMIFPYIDLDESALVIHVHEKKIELCSRVPVDLDLEELSQEFKDVYDIELDPIVRHASIDEPMLYINGTSFGCIFQGENALMKPKAPGDYVYDVMICYIEEPLMSKIPFPLRDTESPQSIKDLCSYNFARKAVCHVEDCGLYGEYVFRGSSVISDAHANALGECPIFQPGLLTCDIDAIVRLEEKDQKRSQQLVEATFIRNEQNDIERMQDILEGIKRAMRDYVNFFEVYDVIIPVVDTFAGHLLYELACEVLDDRYIIAVVDSQYPNVAMQYDFSSAHEVLTVQGCKGDGIDNIEALYQSCVRIAKQERGVAFIPETMTDYMLNQLTPLTNKHVFAPFSHLFASDIFNLNDIFDIERNNDVLTYDEMELDEQTRHDLDNLAEKCVVQYCTNKYRQAQDIPSALGRIWQRLDFDCLQVVRGVDYDINRMDYLIRKFYEIADDMLYTRYLNIIWDIPIKSRYYEAMEEDEQDCFDNSKLTGIFDMSGVAQGIIFKIPLRAPQELSYEPFFEGYPMIMHDELMLDTDIEGIKFNLEGRKPNEEVFSIGMHVGALSDEDDDSVTRSIEIDPRLKEHILNSISRAISDGDESSTAKYMLDMYRLTSLTEDSNGETNLFTQN